MTELSLACMHRLLKKSGIERVSDGATFEMSRALEKLALQIAMEAKMLANHAHRKTIQRKDIEVAVNILYYTKLRV